MALGHCGLAGAFRVGLWDLSRPGCKAFLAYMLMNIAKSESTYSVAVLQCAAQILPLLPPKAAGSWRTSWPGDWRAVCQHPAEQPQAGHGL